MGDSQSLPDLKARIRLDLTQLQADLAKVQEHVKKVGTDSEAAGGTNAFHHVKAGLKAVEEQAKGTIDKLARVTEIVGGIAGGGVFGHSAALLGALNLPGAGALAGIAGAIEGLVKLSDETAKYSTEIARNSELLGINAQELQTYGRIGDQVGVSQETLTTDFLHLQKELADGAPNLKAYGLSLADLGVTTTQTGPALREISSALSTMTDPTLRNAAAQALFGRNAGGVIDILKQGPAAFDAYTASLQKQGLMLTDEQLRQGQAAEATNQQLKQLVESIKLNVGEDLVPIFNEVKTAILNAFGPDPQTAIHNIAEGIAHLASTVASFLQGLFGVPLAFGKSNEASSAAIGAYDEFSSAVAGANDTIDASAEANKAAAAAQKEAAIAVEQLRRQTTLQTQSIDDQVSSIRLQSQQYAKSIDEQVASLRAQSTVIDDQIKLEQQQVQAMDEQIRAADDLQRIQDDLHQSTLVQLQDQLDASRETTSSQRMGSESLMQYQTKLREQSLQEQIKAEQERRKLATDERTAAADAFKTAVQQSIDLLNQRKEDAKKATDAQVAELEKRKSAEKESTDEQIRQLEARKTALDRHLQSVEFSVQQSAAKQGAFQVAAQKTTDVKLLSEQAQANFERAFRQSIADQAMSSAMDQSADEMGKHFHDAIGDFFKDPGGEIMRAALKFGQFIGGEIVQGAKNALFGDKDTEEQKSIFGDLNHDQMVKKLTSMGYTQQQRDQYFKDHPGMSAGGDIQAGVTYLTSEEGAELITSREDAHVFTAAQTRGILGSLPNMSGMGSMFADVGQSIAHLGAMGWQSASSGAVDGASVSERQMRSTMSRNGHARTELGISRADVEASPIVLNVTYNGPQPEEFAMRASMDRLVAEAVRRGVLPAGIGRGIG